MYRIFNKTPDIQQLPAYLKNIESKWKYKVSSRFEREHYDLVKSDKSQNESAPVYILSMFPYPSGRLHLGHVRCYTNGDVLTRFSKLIGKRVINPMGFDSFGLPAENASRERNLEPAIWTNENIRTMKKQLDDLGLKFQWREATSNPKFYKWTQELFLTLFDNNLIYNSYGLVNWDPIDKTVLADEQVDDQGCSWRSGAKVEKRVLKQWFVKVSSFIDEIYQAKDVNPDLWGDILTIQRNWIGQPNGWMFYVPITCNDMKETLLIFVKQPELFMDKKCELVISRDHWLEKIHRISQRGYIINPFTQNKLPVRIATVNDELPKNCQATLMSDQVDSELHEIKRSQVLLIAKLSGFGGYFTSETYRDWLVSRQRFWGTPIPLIELKSGNIAPVDRQRLPIKLPPFPKSVINESNPDAILPLEKLAPKEWLQVTDDSGYPIGKRICETLDTLFDSSWYFLRYASEPTIDAAFDEAQVQPVWCYIGGRIKFKEPFTKLLVQGHVKSKTFKVDGRYLSEDDAKKMTDQSQLTVGFEKMSKSKGNGVDPEDLLQMYGIDATRICLMSYANPRSERLWRSNSEEFREVLQFVRRVIMTVGQYITANTPHIKSQTGLGSPISLQILDEKDLDKAKQDLIEAKNRASLESVIYIQETNEFRQYITSLHKLLNTLRRLITTSAVQQSEFSDALASFLVIFNPLSPHLTEELWSQIVPILKNPEILKPGDAAHFNLDLYIADQKWPWPDMDYQKVVSDNKQRLYKRALSSLVAFQR